MNNDSRQSFKSFSDAGAHLRRAHNMEGGQPMSQYPKSGRDNRGSNSGRDSRTVGQGRNQVLVQEKGVGVGHDTKSALRSRNLSLILTTANIERDQLAAALELPIPRVNELMDGGQAVSQEVAQHIESQLEIEAGWLDQRHTPPIQLSQKTIAILNGEAVSVWNHAADEPHEVEQNAGAVEPTQAVKNDGGLKTQAETNVVPLPSRIEVPVAKIETTPENQATVNASTSRQQESDNNANKENAMSSAEQVQLNRRQNIDNLTASKGSKAKMSRLLGCSAGHITLLINGGRAFLDDSAQNIEALLGLPQHWMDNAHKAEEIPESALMALFHERPVARPNVASSGPKRGRPSAAVLAQRQAEARARGETAGEDEGAAATSAPAASAPVATSAPVVSTPAPVPAPAASASASAPAASAPVPASAPAAAPAPAPAPAPVAASAPAQQAPSYMKEAAAPAPAPAASGVSPIVELLMRTISERATTGKLGDVEAYKLLGGLLGV